MKIPGRRAFTTLILLLLLQLLLTSCAQKLIYSNLDWLAARQIQQYVDLDKDQKAYLNATLEQRLTWHCTTQIPAYLDSLQKLEILAGQTVITDAETEALIADLEKHWQSLSGALAEDLGPLTSTLTQSQVNELFQSLEEEDQEALEEFNETSAAERNEERIEETIDDLEKIIGELNPSQLAAVQAWSTELEPTFRLHQLERQRRRALFRNMLENPDADAEQLTAQLRWLMQDAREDADPRYLARQQANLQRFQQMIAEIQASSSVQQRSRAQKEIRKLQRRVGKLGCNKKAA